MDDEAASYLRSLIETGVFNTIDRKALKKPGEVQALEIGVKVERDSILFYTAVRSSSPNQKARDAMAKIIEIEKSHLVLLGNRLRVARKLF